MLADLLWLLLGLAPILKGGDWFVAAALRLAEFLRMPRVVMGGTLVSLATTSPELVVSIMSGAKGESGLAVGNAIGSCICNLGLILGITAALKQVDVHPRALRTPLVAMFGFGVALFAMTLDLRLARWQGAALLLAGVGYFVWDFWQHWRDRKPGTTAQFAFGAGIVVCESRWLLDGAVGLAASLGIPSIIVGLTVVAVGTSLPELITAITSSRKAVSDLAVGNVLGANIANLSLIVGTASLLQEVTLDRLTQVFNFAALLVVMSLFLWMLLNGHRVTRREGGVLLVAYALYLVALAGLTMFGRT